MLYSPCTHGMRNLLERLMDMNVSGWRSGSCPSPASETVIEGEPVSGLWPVAVTVMSSNSPRGFAPCSS